MTATAHAIVAGAIAAKFPDPLTCSTLAFMSHFVMDTVPHWDIGTNWRNRPKRATALFALAETALGITVAYAIFAGKVDILPLSLAIAAALIPDWLETPWYIFFAHQKKRKPSTDAGAWERLSFMVYRIENIFHAKARFPEGLATQIATVVFFVILLR